MLLFLSGMHGATLPTQKQSFGIAVLFCSLLFTFAAPAHSQGGANEWTWMGGSNTIGSNAGIPGIYGTLGAPAPGNNPGSRLYAVSWTDNNGNFWLFGGNGVDANGNSSSPDDLWKFNPAISEWAWMGGSKATGQSGEYGTLRSPAVGNVPGSRSGAISWTDAKGNLWLFGGFGSDGAGNVGYLNDLWEFSPSTSEWAWMSGSSSMVTCANLTGYSYTYCGPSVPGNLGAPAAGNVPGGREWANSWTDSKGNLWLFGGSGFDPNGNYCSLNDLWEFNPATNEWAWMSGGNTTTSCESDTGGGVIIISVFSESARKRQTRGGSRAYDSSGTTAPGNIPAGRYGASNWTDSSGHLWLFGGWGISGDLNDLWELDPSTSAWTLMSGSSTAWQPGVYGTVGASSAGNVPGSREYASSWIDNSDHLWLFGGLGLDGTGSGKVGYLDDFWEFNPSSKEWTWMGGNSAMTCATTTANGPVCFQPGEYGTLGVPATGNIPGGRYGAVGWTDSQDNFWLFGGFLTNANAQGSLNDLWEYQPTFTALTATVAAGSAASYPVNLPSDVMNVSITCQNLPAGAACSYSANTNALTITTSSTTPAGTYQVTVILTETISGAATAGILLPILLLPLVFLRKKLTAQGLWCAAYMGIILLAATAFNVGCGAGGPNSTPPPQTHQVTSSGVVNLTVR